MRNFALDVIISTGFGYESDSLNNPDNIFKKNIDILMPKIMSLKQVTIFLFYFFIPKLFRQFDWSILDPTAQSFLLILLRRR